MDIYYYCSYTTSPVGFFVGHTSYPPKNNKHNELDEDNIPISIRKCFGRDMVQRVLGVLPCDLTDSPKYCIMTKKLKAKGKSNEPTEYYLNIAFVTESKDEYSNLLQKRDDRDSAKDIAEAIKETMQIDRDNDFGYTVCPDQLDVLVKKSFLDLFDANVVDRALEALRKDEHNTYFFLQPFPADLKKLKDALELSDPNKELKSLKDEGLPKWVCYRKKKRTTRPLPLVAVLVGIALVIAFLISRVVK